MISLPLFADHRMTPIQDDLLCAVQRMQIVLADYDPHTTDTGVLEMIIDALEHIRAPLAMLEHHNGLLLLEALHVVFCDQRHRTIPAIDSATVYQTLKHLADDLEISLSKSILNPERTWMIAATDHLRDVHAQVAPENPTPRTPLVEMKTPTASLLQKSQHILTELVEQAPDQAPAWTLLRTELVSVQAAVTGPHSIPVVQAIARLCRIIDLLEEGAAEYYGILMVGICADILAALGGALEAADHNAAAPTAFLHTADGHLTQCETLLELPPLAPSSVPAAPLLTSPLVQEDEALSITSLGLSDWVGTLSDDKNTAAITPLTMDMGDEKDDNTDPTADIAQLVALIGLSEADPEFIEIFLEEARGELAVIREHLVLWAADWHDHNALTTLRRCFHTLKGSGRMVGATIIGDFAWEFENLINHVLNGSVAPHENIVVAITQAVDALAPLVGDAPLRANALEMLPPLITRAQSLLTDAPTVPVVASIPEIPEITVPALPELPEPWLFAPDADPEFVEAFMGEARNELSIIQQQLTVWQQHFENREVISRLSRGFHTLKGSGRMVGATVFGDFAGQCEHLLGQVLKGAVPLTPAITDLITLLDAGATALLNALDAATVETARATLAQLRQRADQMLQTLMEQGTRLMSMRTMPNAHVDTALTGRSFRVAHEPSSPPAPLPPTPAPTPTPAPIPTPPTPTPAPVETAPALDESLMEVFQYEAAEILDASDLLLQRLSDDPEQPELLDDLRRKLHTLKGSSRMAGIMTVGNLAHAAESVLDAITKGTGRITPLILDGLQQSLDRLNRMMSVAARGALPDAQTDLIEELHHLAAAVTAIRSPEPSEVVLDTPDTALTSDIVTPNTVARQMTELDQEFVQMFQTEAVEILDSSDAIVRRLREESDNADLLNNLRREMHTLKGSSRMAGFMTIGDLAHAAESVLDALGKGTVQAAAPTIVEAIQSALDGLQQMIADVAKGVHPAEQHALIEALRVLSGSPAPRTEIHVPVKAAVVSSMTVPHSVQEAHEPAGKSIAPTTPTAAASAPVDSIRVSAVLLNTLVNQMGESSIFRARIDKGVSGMGRDIHELEQAITRLRRQVGQLATQAESRIQSRQDLNINVQQLDFDPLELDRFTELQQVARSLIEVADDLNSVGTALGEHTHEIATLLDQQGKVNKEIQQGLMRTGMVRFGSISPRLRRIVRQVAQELGKRAELVVAGEELEIDRTVLEKMIPPQEHMLRNSLAHGIETPERRRTVGKSDIGTITLSLRREGAELVLEMTDDGAGFNFEAIRAKGEEKGFLEPGQPATEDDLIALLLRPGFSTASAITQISGRGVGMDVVNETIRAMRGALLIHSTTGQGTQFTIRLPFSLSVTQALLVRAGEFTYAVPLLSIELVTRVEEKAFHGYLTGEQVTHEYNGRRYPIHNLGILVGGAQLASFEEVADRCPPVLLFRSAEASAAVQVEGVEGNQEVIVKPLGPQFNGLPGLSGATVLGDGRVVVVLELAALVRHIGSQHQKQSESRALRAARQETRPDKICIMVIDDSITMRKVTARFLGRHNIEAITAKDGLDAVTQLQTRVPDLAILDIEMPRMDGFEVLTHVRNQRNLRHLPVIMVTSRSGEKHRQRAFSLGVNDYLSKPYQEDQLMQAIRNILGERALMLIT